MNCKCVWAVLVLALLCAAEGGSSLRGAVEALQRRQRGHVRGPLLPPPEYDALYEFVPPPGYPEPDYAMNVEDLAEETAPKYIVKLLDDEDRPDSSYEYKIIKKKNLHPDSATRKESAFRERSHHSDNDRLRDLFTDKNEEDDKNDVFGDKVENDAEYAILLSQLWSKYKNNKAHPKTTENAPQGVVKLYKDKIVKKRYPDNWGPIAFKRKRSSNIEDDRPISSEYDERKTPDASNSNYYKYDNNDDTDDWREEYAIAFQPLDDTVNDFGDDDQYTYDNVEKRFPVSKRSSGSFPINNQKKRFVQGKHDMSKTFRSSSGTDPKIIKDLSKIFGDDSFEIKSPVKKRSTDRDEHSHEGKPPQITVAKHNVTHERNNSSKHEDNSHEHHAGHSMHPPGISGKEIEHMDEHSSTEKPIIVRKKSIDWSDYFGIDKRTNKPVAFVNDLTQNRLRNNYLNTFNKEVIYPLHAFRKRSYVKRNWMQAKPSEEPEPVTAQDPSSTSEDKINNLKEEDSKLDNIDQKLKTMEGMIVDEALQYSNADEELDSKEEQEKKEIIISRLAAAYSLEKMRKALKEFKQSLQTQRHMPQKDESKSKRVAVKKELNNNEIPARNNENDDFEDEQGAGHYLNGKIEQYSEGYMGGSGRHRIPVMSTAVTPGSCPVLARIVQRCRGVDMLAGDRGQLFLPLCSLHQICYLCGEAPPTTCDLVFLSEADTTCEGDMGCQRAARSALMALRELHDNLADELDGECEASPCLPATLKLNTGWQKALQR